MVLRDPTRSAAAKEAAPASTNSKKDPPGVTAVSYWPLSPSPFSSSHAVATAPSSTAPAAACARRRRASGDHLVHRTCPSPSPHRARTHQHSNSPARAPQRRSRLTRAPTAAAELLTVACGHPRPGWHHRLMRAGLGSRTSPATLRTGHRSLFLRCSAVSGLAGGLTPMGLTALTAPACQVGPARQVISLS